MGADLGLRYQLNDYLYFDADANYTYARSIDEPDGQTTFLLHQISHQLEVFKMVWTFRVTIPLFKSRPANEDNSIVAKGYAIADFNINMNIKVSLLGYQLRNLLNTKWNETQFATESRLKRRANSVEEIHFTLEHPFL
jgi:outer membrane receptor protein involved in Fe transport